jgi:hypothetical protein
MPCLFCGATDRKMSNEHVWPKWVRELLPTDVQKAPVTYTFETHDGEVRKFSTTLFELKVKDVCKPCNETWMSRYETNAQRWMTGMLQGRGRELHSTGQTQIAAWAVLKCLIGQRTYPQDSIIPDGHYKQVYDLREAERPPLRPQVFTARAGWSQGAAPPGLFRVNGIGLRTDPEFPESGSVRGYMATLSVMDLIVQVFWPYDSSPDGNFEHPPGYRSSLHRIWPVSGSFVWPPGPTLTGAGIVGLAGPEPQ